MPRRLTITLPDTALADTRDVAHIHGVAGLTGDRTTLSMAGRFRPNHHTTSDVGLIGGGDLPMPGEGSPAHHGMLFLDAWPEFRRHVLEVLRQPLEDGHMNQPVIF